jgi:RNA polymerase sigma-70 factor (ECF subfamily)
MSGAFKPAGLGFPGGPAGGTGSGAAAKYRVESSSPKEDAQMRNARPPSVPAVGRQAVGAAAQPVAGAAAPATDADLIGRSRADPELFAAIFDRHAAEIHRYAARRLDQQSAADVVSEVFLAAFRNRERYDPARADARPWLYGITTKVVSQQLRSDGRRSRLSAAIPATPPAEFPVDEISDRIAAAQLRPRLLAVLAGLSPADRELVLLVAWADLTYEQVAEAMDLPIGTVRSRLHRVRAKVRGLMGPIGPAAPANEEPPHG